MDDSGNIKKKAEFFPPFREIHNIASEQARFYLPFDKISDNEPSELLNSQPSCKTNDMGFSLLSSNYSPDKNENSVHFSIANSRVKGELEDTFEIDCELNKPQIDSV